jgi:hypothetical protein
MAKRKVFVSYDHSEDAHYKRLLQAWDANPDFDFEFDSRGPNVAINSDAAAVVKGSLTKMMQTATHLLVIVGAKSAKSSWIAWEIEKAKELRLKLAVVKIDNSYTTPSGLLNAGAVFARSFTRDNVVQALKDA